MLIAAPETVRKSLGPLMLANVYRYLHVLAEDWRTCTVMLRKISAAMRWKEVPVGVNTGAPMRNGF